MLRLRPNVILDVQQQALMGLFDCRLLFLGDHTRQLVRAYEEIVLRYTRNKDLNALRKSLESSAEIQQFYEIAQDNGKVSVLMRDAIFKQQGPLEEVRLSINISDGNREWKYPLPLDRVRALGNLLPLLQGRHSEVAVSEMLSGRISQQEMEWAQGLLNHLRENNCLVHDNRANSLRTLKSSPRITFLGHSSMLFESKESSVLIDPFLRRKFGLPRKGDDVFGLDLGAVCCSHSHWDHCDLQTLLFVNKDTPILIPMVSKPSAFNPPIVPALQLLGFTDIREVQLWNPVQISDIEVIPIPFHGEQDEPDAEIDHYTYVVRTPGLSLYGGVDCYRDTFGDMKPVLEQVRDKYKPDIAFLPVSRMIYEYKYGGVNAYCRYFDNTLLDQSFQYTASAQEAAEWMRILGATWVSPYAIFTFSRWRTPREVGEFATALKSVGLMERLYPLRPFDRLNVSDLKGSGISRLRRRALLRWFRIGQSCSKLDSRLRRNRWYGLMRKVLNHLLPKGRSS